MKTSPTPSHSGLAMAAFDVSSAGTPCAYPSKDLDEIKLTPKYDNIAQISLIFDLNQTSGACSLVMCRGPRLSLNPIIDNPFAVFAIALVTQWGAAFAGDLLRTAAWALMILIY